MRHSSSVRSADRGFSFVEILFAIGVLGIGFIMIAAIFPVGLKQTKQTLDESAAAANARGAVASLFNVAPVTSSTGTTALPGTLSPTGVSGVTVARVPDPYSRVTIPGQVRAFRDPRLFADAVADADFHNNRFWNRIATESVSTADDRNATVVLFKRDFIAVKKAGAIESVTPAGSAQVIVINAQVANRGVYEPADVYATPAKPLYNLEPRPVGVTIYKTTDGESIITFSPVGTPAAQGFTATPQSNAAPNAVAEGGYVVISDDQITTPVTDIGRMNGRIYRVGVARPDISATSWQLAPGFEFQPDPGFSGAFGDSIATSPNDDITKVGITTSGGGSSVTVNGPAVAFILGRGFDDVANPPQGNASGAYTGTARYSGLAQDIAVYTTFVPVP